MSDNLDVFQITDKDRINLLRPGMLRFVNDILNDDINRPLIVQMMKDDAYIDIIEFVGNKLLEKANSFGNEQ